MPGAHRKTTTLSGADAGGTDCPLRKAGSEVVVVFRGWGGGAAVDVRREALRRAAEVSGGCIGIMAIDVRREALKCGVVGVLECCICGIAVGVRREALDCGAADARWELLWRCVDEMVK